jgi:hypothetical protein
LINASQIKRATCVAPFFRWFTEGPDTPGLNEAKASLGSIVTASAGSTSPASKRTSNVGPKQDLDRFPGAAASSWELDAGSLELA